MPLLRARDLAPVVAKARCRRRFTRLRDELDALARETPALKQVMFFNDGSGAFDALETHLAAMPTRFAACDTAQDDVALIAFTSGTTGTPKGTMHFHRDIVAMCDLFPRHVLRPQADDVFCGTPPLAFTFGLGACCAFRCACARWCCPARHAETLLGTSSRERALHRRRCTGRWPRS